MLKVITIEGPTASGKSDFAFKLAKVLGTEIISADSRQVYKYLDIGTAKPDKQTLHEVKHHLISIITPDKRYSAGAFMADTQKIIVKLNELGKIPIICGGTMLYIQSLLNGLSKVPDVPEKIKQQTSDFMKCNSLNQCYEFVEKIDPKFAKKITKTDKQRISRAIEVWFAFNKPLTEFWDCCEPLLPLTACKILLTKDRNELYTIIGCRMQQMVKNGLTDEIQKIINMGYSAEDYGLNTVGYKEFLNYNFEIAVEKATQNTRNYAKRQLTWYRKQKFDLIVNENMSVNDRLVKEKINQFM